jgi:hypothetical protein
VSDEPTSDAGMAAALAQSYAQDAHAFLPSIASFLEGSLPENTEVERESVGWFSGKKRVVGLKLTMGDWVYTLHEDTHHNALQAKRSKTVRGVTLKTEAINVSVFLQEMCGWLSERTKENENTFYALKEFLKF